MRGSAARLVEEIKSAQSLRLGIRAFRDGNTVVRFCTAINIPSICYYAPEDVPDVVIFIHILFPDAQIRVFQTQSSLFIGKTN